MKLHTEEKFKCEICDRRFSLMIHLKNHVTYIHESSGKVCCDICAKSFKRKSSLLTHKCKHQNTENGKIVIGKRNLKKKLMRENKPKFECELCPKVFSFKDNKARHVISIHEKKARWKCDVCDKPFIYRNVFNDHVKEHFGDERKLKPFQCKICSKNFPQKSKLQDHIDSAHDHKRFRCEFCNKELMRKSCLKKHLNSIHGPTKRLQCNFCVKTLKTKESLKKHIGLIHLKKEEIKCDYCDKIFHSKGNLQRHKQIHESDDIFQCNLCPKTYKSKASLKVHNNVKHTKKEGKKCEFCEITIASKCNFSRHLRLVHKIL